MTKESKCTNLTADAEIRLDGSGVEPKFVDAYSVVVLYYLDLTS